MARGYRNLLQASLVAGAALLGINQAHAITAAPEFELIESGDVYTVKNNSSNEWIYAFSVTNPLASTDPDWTTQAGWSAGKQYAFEHFHFVPVGYTYFAKLSDPPFYSEIVGRGRNAHLEFLPNTTVDIGPGQSSSLFFFGPAEDPPGSVTFDLVGNDILSTFNVDVTATPLPATWTMMLIGMIGLGFLGYRHRKNGALSPAA